MQHQLFSDYLAITINFCGAELCSVKNKNGLEFMWHAQKDIWARHAPNLFPIVGKLKDNSYVLNEKKFHMGQHGFARDCVFELIKFNSSSCVFQLKQNNETKSKYPFDFIFEVKYELNGNSLNIVYKISNPSKENLLFSVGAHPAFKIPLDAEEKFEDYYLQFSDTSLERTKLENGLITKSKSLVGLQNKQLALSIALFDEDALVFENNQINQIALISSKTAHKITLKCQNWPFFGIWSKKGCNDFVCLEPWYGIADSVESTQNLSEKKGIISLQSGKTFECAYNIAFE
jgi:galactose mutarotase-like enzyme